MTNNQERLMNDEDPTPANDLLLTKEERQSQSIALAVKLATEFQTWAEQDRAVYTSEVMERELDKLFPVETFLERKRRLQENFLDPAENRDR